MLFDSLFKGDKGITIGKRRKRKLTVRDVIDRLNKFDLTTANCTLIRDHLGNEKIENYGQVDVFRVRDEEIFVVENTFCITTPTGMKLKGDVGESDFGHIVSMVSSGSAESGEEKEIEEIAEDEGEAVEGDEVLVPIQAETPSETAEEKKSEEAGDRASDAFSDGGPHQRAAFSEAADVVLGVGQTIRLRFFSRRVPYEIDCQIVDRFAPSRLKETVDLTPRFGVGYRVRPVTDLRNRDQRRYIRYTHRVGFGHLRLRTEIQFYVFAHRTNIEIPEKGVLNPTLTGDDFKIMPYGVQDVEELKGAERIEDVVEFFMRCMLSNPTERRHVYISKPFFDHNRRKSSLEGLGYHTTVGAQQTTILPKIFLKKPLKGKSVLERMLAAKGKGPRDTHKMRIIEDIEDRYSLLTRERKVWNARRRQKRVESYDNDTCFLGFISSHGVAPGSSYSVRPMSMYCELIDIGVENLTLKPSHYEDDRSRRLDLKEYVRQEDGFQVDLLNFSVGGAQIRGSEEEGANEAFLKYLVGEEYDRLSFDNRIEALRKHAVLLHFYPVLTFTRSQIQEYEPYLPFKIPVIARVARFRTARNSEDEPPQIVSMGLEFIYNPMHDAYSRDLNFYDKWEQITPYTENQQFIEVHKSLQLLFGFDRALDEDFREDRTGKEKEVKEGGEAGPDQN